jgi:hypothetical protein
MRGMVVRSRNEGLNLSAFRDRMPARRKRLLESPLKSPVRRRGYFSSLRTESRSPAYDFALTSAKRTNFTSEPMRMLIGPAELIFRHALPGLRPHTGK